MTRETTLSTIRRSLGRPAGTPIPPRPPILPPRQPGAPDEEIDLLIEEGETGGTGGPGGAGDAGNFIPEFDASSLPGLSKADASPKQAVPVGSPDAAPDAASNDEPLQIELSDKDLEALLTELEHSSSATAKKAPDPKPGPGSEEAE